jgi:hypothetical protein
MLAVHPCSAGPELIEVPLRELDAHDQRAETNALGSPDALDVVSGEVASWAATVALWEAVSEPSNPVFRLLLTDLHSRLTAECKLIIGKRVCVVGNPGAGLACGQLQ